MDRPTRELIAEARDTMRQLQRVRAELQAVREQVRRTVQQTQSVRRLREKFAEQHPNG
jgi:uncharacterized coiled-coil DUF342 family protein